MRVITRHSKLLYFLKHLPRWQFRTLSAIVRLEAAIRGRWSRLFGRPDEVRGVGGDRRGGASAAAWRVGREDVTCWRWPNSMTDRASRLESGLRVRRLSADSESGCFPLGRQGSTEAARRLSPTLLEPRKDGSA